MYIIKLVKIKFVNKYVCEKTKRHIWCCRNGDYARGSELEILNKKDKMPITNNKKVKKNTEY